MRLSVETEKLRTGFELGSSQLHTTIGCTETVKTIILSTTIMAGTILRRAGGWLVRHDGTITFVDMKYSGFSMANFDKKITVQRSFAADQVNQQHAH